MNEQDRRIRLLHHRLPADRAAKMMLKSNKTTLVITRVSRRPHKSHEIHRLTSVRALTTLLQATARMIRLLLSSFLSGLRCRPQHDHSTHRLHTTTRHQTAWLLHLQPRTTKQIKLPITLQHGTRILLNPLSVQKCQSNNSRTYNSISIRLRPLGEVPSCHKCATCWQRSTVCSSDKA